ncbi:MAG TPA: hypothetical protein VNM92_08540 [Thermoanaerobaculia bacterium]|nr:hypothetical protein [Thermoanaerobaculia bacterium]
MKQKCLLLTSVLTVFVMTLPLFAEVTGTWSGAAKPNGKIQMSLKRANYQHSTPMAIASFRGLNEAMIQSTASSPVSFSLDREAGAIRFTGHFSDGLGSGHFRFEPAASFSSVMQSLGVRTQRKNRTVPNENDLFEMAMFDISSQMVRELASLGLRELSLDQIVSLKIHGAGTEYIRGMQALGYKSVSVDDIVSLRIHGVSPEYVQAMAARGFRPTAEELTSMKIHGVSAAWVQDIRSAGYTALTVEDLVSMRIHGVSSEFVREMRLLGYEKLTADDLVSLRIHGVSTSFIRELRDAGYERVPVEKLVKMKIHGLDKKFLRAVRGKK